MSHARFCIGSQLGLARKRIVFKKMDTGLRGPIVAQSWTGPIEGLGSSGSKTCAAWSRVPHPPSAERLATNAIRQPRPDCPGGFGR